MKYVADGVFIEELYKEKPKDFVFIDKVLCYYNSLRKENSGNFLPRVMLLGSEKDLKSVKRAQYESDDLKVFYTKDHEVLDTIINHCRTISYGQFTQEEILNGTAWRLLNNETAA